MLPLNVLVLDAIQRAYAELRYFFLAVRIVTLTALAATLYFVTTRCGLVATILAVVVINVIHKSIVATRLGFLLGVQRRDVRLLRDVGKLAVASLAAAGTAALVRHSLAAHPAAVVAACGVVFAPVFAVVVLATGVLSVDERAFFRAQVARVQRILVWRRVWVR
jgi:hypothetical protein